MTQRPPANRVASVPPPRANSRASAPASATGRRAWGVPLLDDCRNLGRKRAANDVTRPPRQQKLRSLRLSASEERLAHELVESFMATVAAMGRGR
jgi:hypothetical protein